MWLAGIQFSIVSILYISTDICLENGENKEWLVWTKKQSIYQDGMPRSDTYEVLSLKAANKTDIPYQKGYVTIQSYGITDQG